MKTILYDNIFNKKKITFITFSALAESLEGKYWHKRYCRKAIITRYWITLVLWCYCRLKLCFYKRINFWGILFYLLQMTWNIVVTCGLHNAKRSCKNEIWWFLSPVPDISMVLSLVIFYESRPSCIRKPQCL